MILRAHIICNNLINGLPPIAHKYRTRCNGKPSAMSSRAGVGGDARSCCSSNKTEGTITYYWFMISKMNSFALIRSTAMDGDWKAGACAPVASRLLLFQTQNWIRALGTIDSQTKCTRGKEALLQDSPPGDIIIIITLRLLKTARKPAGICAMINCFALGTGRVVPLLLVTAWVLKTGSECN